jgi:acetyl-CoA C-acetyltransferase
MGESYGFDAVAIQRYPQVEAIRHVHHAGNSLGHRRRRRGVLVGKRKPARAGPQAAWPHRHVVQHRAASRASCSTGPAPSAEKALKRAGLSVATSTCSRSTRPSRRSCCAS